MATSDGLRRKIEANRERASMGAGVSDQELREIFQKGAVRRGLSQNPLFAWGGHNAAQDFAKQKYGLTEMQARSGTNVARVRRSVGKTTVAVAAVTLAVGGVAAAPIVVGAAGLGLAAWGNKARKDAMREQIEKAQARQAPKQDQAPQVQPDQAPQLDQTPQVPQQAPGGRKLQAVSVNQVGPGQGTPQAPRRSQFVRAA